MKKVYYFPHEYNSANDPKIICLTGNYGGLGYGLFWLIIEMLHQDETHKLPKKLYVYEAIAKQMLASAKQIEAIISDCINKYELFNADSEYFWSDRVLRNIEMQTEISEKRREAGRLGGKCKQMLSKTKQNVANKIKINKIKINNNSNILVSSELDNSDVVSSEQNLTTPKNISDNFFNNEQDRNEKIDLLIKKNNWPEQSVKQEIAKFISYWTELNSTGKKQRWEMEKTFEIDRRLATWFSRAAKFAPEQSRFINLDNL